MDQTNLDRIPSDLEFILQLLPENASKDKATQQDILLEIVADVELFYTPNDKCYARVPVNGHYETLAIKSKGFERWLVHEFFKSQEKGPGGASLSGALRILEARAQFDAPEKPVCVRMAECDENIYIDLANKSREVVEITADGWHVTTETPVNFIRPRNMLPLPHPERGGSVEELRPFLNVASDPDFYLIVAWMLAALRGRGPYPVSALTGEQGGAKSTVARAKRALIDPNISLLRSAPRDEHDLIIAATNSWVQAYDNLSGIPPWLSDAFCRLSTGGGISCRQLYTDGEEFLLDAMRPIILNGIDSLTGRSDLADRALIFNLPPIPEDKRRPEKEFWADFERVRPWILGALLDAVSAGLRNYKNIKLSSLPRMADFAIWVSACEPALPWPAGSFMAAYTGNRQEVIELTLEADVVAAAVRAFMAGGDEWAGPATNLLEALREHVPNHTSKSSS